MTPANGPGRKRSAASDETRTRILGAARDLAVDEGFSGFTVDKVARQAGVSRMTVYYQFGSKSDLLNALFDHLAERGQIQRLRDVFQEPDPLEALARFIVVFCGFWASDRIGLRRLRAWARVESESDEPELHRDLWRRDGLVIILGRIREQYGIPNADTLTDVIDLLHTLTSFENYDILARGERSEAEIAELLTGAARAIIGIDAAERP